MQGLVAFGRDRGLFGAHGTGAFVERVALGLLALECPAYFASLAQVLHAPALALGQLGSAAIVCLFGLRGALLVSLQVALYTHKVGAHLVAVRGIVAVLLLHGFELAAVIGVFAGRAGADLFGRLAPLAHGYEELFALVNGLDAAIELKARLLHGLLGFGQREAHLFELGLAGGKAGIAFFGRLAEGGKFVLQRGDLGAEGEETLASQAHVELV